MNGPSGARRHCLVSFDGCFSFHYLTKKPILVNPFLGSLWPIHFCCCVLLLLCVVVVVVVVVLCVGCGCWFSTSGPALRRKTRRRTSLRWTAQNCAFFFPSHAAISFLFSLSGCFLVEVGGCFRRQGPSNVRVWALGLSFETPAASGSPRLKHHQNTTRRPQEKERKRRKWSGERGEKKRENLGLFTLQGRNFLGRTLRGRNLRELTLREPTLRAPRGELHAQQLSTAPMNSRRSSL